MCTFLHAFVHLVPPNLTFIQLFTYQSPLFKNARKHQFLHAFVRWLKTSLFTRLWSRNIMGWTQPPPKEGETKIILRENIIFEYELPPNLIFYMLLDTSPTSSRNISFYQVWWASIQKVKKHYTFCPPRSDDYANLFAHERHLPAGQLSCHPRSSSGRQSDAVRRAQN